MAGGERRGRRGRVARRAEERNDGAEGVSEGLEKDEEGGNTRQGKHEAGGTGRIKERAEQRLAQIGRAIVMDSSQLYALLLLGVPSAQSSLVRPTRWRERARLESLDHRALVQIHDHARRLCCRSHVQ